MKCFPFLIKIFLEKKNGRNVTRVNKNFAKKISSFQMLSKQNENSAMIASVLKEH
jgi:hypothetical protein